MIHPDDEDKPFVARWCTLIDALLIEPSIKLVARTACDYGIRDGEGIYPGNERLARQTGYAERTVREAWHFLRAADMAYRDGRSAWTGAYRTADSYTLSIPPDWRSLPILGPSLGKFTCQQCGRKFSPPPCNAWGTRETAKGKVPATDKDGVRQVRWWLYRAVFCPTPVRGPRKGKGCFEAWSRAHRGGWSALSTDEAWAMYREARGEDWPSRPRLAAA